MPSRSIRRILAVGGSKAVALPPDWLSAFGLDVGDKIDVIYGSIVLVKPVGMRLDRGFLLKGLRKLNVKHQCTTSKPPEGKIRDA